MKANTAHQKAETFYVSAMLAIVGGFLDAYTYIMRDGVLANAQTGNMVFMAINVMSGEWKQAFFHFVPILFFAIGIVIVEKIRFQKHAIPLFHWQQIVLVIECLILLAVSFIPSGPFNTAVNLAVSLTCSMQVQSFRSLHGRPFASTMCTGNLRSGTELFFLYTQTQDKTHLKACGHYFGIIGHFLIGVVLGAGLSHWVHEKATLLCCVILFVCLLMLKKSTSQSAQENS